MGFSLQCDGYAYGGDSGKEVVIGLAVVMVRVLMVMRTMVTVVVEAVIGVTMANGDGYNGYAGERVTVA